MKPLDPDPSGPEPHPASSSEREVRYRFSRGFPQLLEDLAVSLLVSTYQAGKLIGIGVAAEKPLLTFHNYDRPMGVAASGNRLAVGTRQQVWLHHNADDVARQINPPGHWDACFVARTAQQTGEIQGHEMAWAVDGELWVVNTLFSCLCTLSSSYSFVPRWRPPFITEMAADDRCHLNGLAMESGVPRFVTALGESDCAEGWRPGKLDGGCVIEVASGETVTRGLCMPHSPRVHQGQLLVLNSGTGQIVRIEIPRGTFAPISEELPGYARGLALLGPIAFVGLSKIRETSTFGGLPIDSRRTDLRCGIAAVHLESGKTIATLEFETGVEEIFDVCVLPGIRMPAIRGPHADVDGYANVWIVPDPAASGSDTLHRNP